MPAWHELTQHSPPPHDMPLQVAGLQVPRSISVGGAEHDGTCGLPSAQSPGAQRHDPANG